MCISMTSTSGFHATFELKPAGSGTRPGYTEQVAFPDGYAGSREHRTRELLDNLGKALARVGPAPEV